MAKNHLIWLILALVFFQASLATAQETSQSSYKQNLYSIVKKQQAHNLPTSLSVLVGFGSVGLSASLVIWFLRAIIVSLAYRYKSLSVGVKIKLNGAEISIKGNTDKED